MTKKSALLLGLLFIASNVLAAEKKLMKTVGTSCTTNGKGVALKGVALISYKKHDKIPLHLPSSFHIKFNFEVEDSIPLKELSRNQSLNLSIDSKLTIDYLGSKLPIVQLLYIFSDATEEYYGPKETKEKFITSAKKFLEKLKP